MDRRTQSQMLLLAFLAGGVGACEGALGEGADGPGEPGVSGTPADVRSEEIAEEIAKTNQELKKLDPELFNIAKEYFPSDEAGVSEARVFRLTRRQLDTTADAVLPFESSSSALEMMPRDPLVKNYELSDNLEFNAANFTPFVDWIAGRAAGALESPQSLIDCETASDKETCSRTAVKQFVSAAFRGVAPEADLNRYADFYVSSVAEVGVGQATADLVELVLSSPLFTFREEVFADASGMILPAQALQNLSYTLTDRPPQAMGFDLGQAANHVAPEVVEQTVSSLLEAEEARDKLVRFFIAWLEVKEPADFEISPVVFPEFTPELAAAMVNETTQFLKQRLTSAAPSLKDVSQSTESFVDEMMAEIYGTTKGADGMLSPLDSSQRLGVLTHPSVITSHSGPDTTRLVKRGVFFTRKVMCQELGSPPPGTVPEGEIPGDTERERIETITANPPCSGCHAYINPFGFMQESYDPLGRFRETDEHGFPVDPAIVVNFLDEGPTTFDQPVEALTGFTDSLMFKQCFVRQLFNFYTGRQPEKADDPVLRETFFHFARGEQEIIPALLRMVGNADFNRRSDSILRTETP